MQNKSSGGIKIITENRKSRFNYHLTDKFEAGLVLNGSEVKSLRAGEVNLGDAYGIVRNGEAYLLNCHISPYQRMHYADHDPLRSRKLLLHHHEIMKLTGRIREKGLTLIPTKMYFRGGRAKVELALGKSKKTVDKRQAIRKRDMDREVRRAVKR